MKPAVRKHDKNDCLSIAERAGRAFGHVERSGMIEILLGHFLVTPSDTNYDEEYEHGEFDDAKQVDQVDAPSPRDAVEETAEGVYRNGNCADAPSC